MTVLVSNYPSEFASAPTPYEAAEPSIFLGVEPVLLLLILAAVAAAAAAAYYAGRQGRGDGPGGADDAAKDIHAAILAYARMAMTAESGELRSRVEALREAVRRLLGPVLDLARGVEGPVKQIDEALKGEIKVEAKPDRPDHRPRHPQSVPQPAVTQILIGVSPNAPPTEAAGRDRGHGEPGAHERPREPEKPRTETRKMTTEEQTDALARAARAFHDHWAKAQRVQELRDARRALSTTPPAPPKPPQERKRAWER